MPEQVSAAEASYAEVLAALVAAGYPRAHIQADLAGAFVCVPLDDADDSPYILVGIPDETPDGWADIPPDRGDVTGWHATLHFWDGGYAGIVATIAADTTASLVHLVQAVFAGVQIQ